MKATFRVLRLVGLLLSGVLIGLMVATLVGGLVVEAVVGWLAAPGGAGVWPRALGQLLYDLWYFGAVAVYARLLRGRLLPPSWWGSVGAQLGVALVVEVGVTGLIVGQWPLDVTRMIGRGMAIVVVVLGALLVGERQTDQPAGEDAVAAALGSPAVSNGDEGDAGGETPAVRD